ncbi:rod shape-determining protein MreD [Ornithinimicrobium avium]|uniref:Rod shape-determining protein MreD n=1 Tax=Ornithinimicrobium avium TaxID=2283195 RepID=A0A345NLH5_9MICO|nr:rod shape-determining protein MreD [Ornithinimicrobium avium]AXH95883.1 rod shape-determining protein MreD [Ornithinimicrobium avium]
MTAPVRALLRGLLLLLAVLLPAVWPSGAPRPDLVVLVVAAAALGRGPLTGLLTGLAGGWLIDLVPPGAEPLGAGALAYAAVGAVLGSARRYAALSPLVPWVAAVVGSGLVLGVRWVSAAAGAGRAEPAELLRTWGVTAVVAVVLVPVLRSLERRVRPRAERDAPC